MFKVSIRFFVLLLCCVAASFTAMGRGSVVFNRDTGFSLSQNKLVDGKRNLHALVSFIVKDNANASATATLRLEDANGNVLTTTEGKASTSRSLNLRGNNNASFNMKFDIPNRHFLTESRIGKRLKAVFILKIDGQEVLNVNRYFTAERSKASGSQNGTNVKKKNRTTSTPAPKIKKQKKSKTKTSSDAQQWEEQCPICGGGGKCNICHGAGQYYSPAAGMMWPCGACYSSGNCRMCNGKGVNVYRVYSVNGIRYMQLNYDRPAVLGGGRDSRPCGACCGSGNCAVCLGSGQGVSYTGYAPKCSACGGSGQCSRCKGLGYRD